MSIWLAPERPWTEPTKTPFQVQWGAVAGCQMVVILNLKGRAHWQTTTNGRELGSGYEAEGEAARRAAENAARKKGTH